MPWCTLWELSSSWWSWEGLLISVRENLSQRSCSGTQGLVLVVTSCFTAGVHVWDLMWLKMLHLFLFWDAILGNINSYPIFFHNWILLKCEPNGINGLQFLYLVVVIYLEVCSSYTTFHINVSVINVYFINQNIWTDSS